MKAPPNYGVSPIHRKRMNIAHSLKPFYCTTLVELKAVAEQHLRPQHVQDQSIPCHPVSHTRDDCPLSQRSTQDSRPTWDGSYPCLSSRLQGAQPVYSFNMDAIRPCWICKLIRCKHIKAMIRTSCVL